MKFARRPSKWPKRGNVGLVGTPGLYCWSYLNIDLTVLPTSSGFWSPRHPFSLLQSHPDAWHILVVIDHFSRKVLGFDLFEQNPRSEAVTFALDRIFVKHGPPKHLISDHGSQYYCQHFHDWCKRNGIKNRYGAIGRHGSIALTERVIRTFKDSCSQRILVPVSHPKMEEETRLFFEWYNEYRPHASLYGRTPNEIFFHRRAKNTLPRVETRPLLRHTTSCVSPRMMISDKSGAKVMTRNEFYGGRRHLPILYVERVYAACLKRSMVLRPSSGYIYQHFLSFCRPMIIFIFAKVQRRPVVGFFVSQTP